MLCVSIYVVDVKAYEEIWVIGDRFDNKTCFNYFTNVAATANHLKSEQTYVIKNYDVKTYSGYHNKDVNPSYLACMQGQLIKAIHDRKLLPKAVIVVIEDDLIVDADFKEAGMAIVFKEHIEWLVSEFDSILQEYQGKLPEKAFHEDYTKFLWIAAPHHDSFSNNNARKKFNSALYAVVTPIANMNTIKLKGYWDTKNFRLVNKGRLTGEGLFRYWEAIDMGFQFWQEVMLPSRRRQFSNENRPTASKTDGLADKDKGQQRIQSIIVKPNQNSTWNSQYCTLVRKRLPFSSNRHWQTIKVKKLKDEVQRKLPTPTKKQ